MAERQETSVMASIQDILRDAQLREEQEKQAAQRAAEDAERARLEAIRRQQEEEEARMRGEEEERQRRAFEEQRKAAELAAIQEATIQRARMEAEAQARHAEMIARQEHERHIHALQHDKSKKNLKWIAIGASAFLVIGLVVGGVMIKNSMDKQAQQAQELRDLQDKVAKEQQERAQLQAQLENTKDPEQIAALKAQLAEKDQKISNMNTEIKNKPTSGGVYRGGAPANPGNAGATPPPRPNKPCNCSPGDPLCSCL